MIRKTIKKVFVKILNAILKSIRYFRSLLYYNSDFMQSLLVVSYKLPPKKKRKSQIEFSNFRNLIHINVYS